MVSGVFSIAGEKHCIEVSVSETGLGLFVERGFALPQNILKEQIRMLREPSSRQNSLHDASSGRIYESSLGASKDVAIGRESGQTSSAASSIGGFLAEVNSTSATSPVANQRVDFNLKDKRCSTQHSALTLAIDNIDTKGLQSYKGVLGMLEKTNCILHNQIAASFDQFVDVEDTAQSLNLAVQQQQYQMLQERKAVEDRTKLLESSVLAGSLSKSDATKAIAQAAQIVTAKNINALPAGKGEPYPIVSEVNMSTKHEYSEIEDAHDEGYYQSRGYDKLSPRARPNVVTEKSLNLM